MFPVTVAEGWYETTKDAPEYARDTLNKLVARGILRGTSENSQEVALDMSEGAIRVLVLLDRAGAFGN